MRWAEGIARLRLIRTARIGPVSFHQLMRRFGDAETALAALPQILARRGGAHRQIASAASIDEELGRVSASDARHIFWDEPDYPLYLKEIDAPPPVLIVRGRAELLQRPTVAIVGARNASAAACRFARQIAMDVGKAGVTVISGLARGVDTAAHMGALHGGTAAVIASGHDIVFPPENADLQEKIGAEHLLISEYPPKTEPIARQFPARNRIIAGAACATLVVEAAPKSGSLITARQAGEFGRDVLAVPGSPLDPRAQGCNRLIQDGAILVQSAADILSIIQPMDPRMARRSPPPLRADNHAAQQGLLWDDEPERGLAEEAAPPQDVAHHITDLLGQTPISIDELVRQSGRDMAAVQMALLDLEMEGRLERHAGSRISLIG